MDASKSQNLRFSGKRISQAIKAAIVESEMSENTEEDNVLFMKSIQSKVPTVIKGSFLNAVIITRSRSKKDRSVKV